MTKKEHDITFEHTLVIAGNGGSLSHTPATDTPPSDDGMRIKVEVDCLKRYLEKVTADVNECVGTEQSMATTGRRRCGPYYENDKTRLCTFVTWPYLKHRYNS